LPKVKPHITLKQLIFSGFLLIYLGYFKTYKSCFFKEYTKSQSIGHNMAGRDKKKGKQKSTQTQSTLELAESKCVTVQHKYSGLIASDHVPNLPKL